MKKIKILVVPSDLYGVGTFRFVEPHVEIQKQFGEEFIIDINNDQVDFNDIEGLKTYDIIFGNKEMCTYDVALKSFPLLREHGTKIIMDMDDHWNLPKNHPYYNYAIHTKYAEKVKLMLALADYVVTTTDAFANEIREFNPNVLVFPNAIDPTSKKFRINETESDLVRVGWLGGSTHLEDIKLLQPMFASANQKYKGQIQTVLCGFDLRGHATDRDQNGQEIQRKIQPKETCWYEYEKIFTAGYSSISPEHKEHLLKFNETVKFDDSDTQYKRVWTKPMTTYSSNYNLMDIVLAPLVINKFNMAKSQLKVIESGFFKKALIASDITPYQIDIVHGVNGLLVDNKSGKKNWTYYMNKLMNDKALIKELGENLYDTVKDKYDLRKVSQNRADFYRSLINNK